jgi:glucose/arabinose dehydrogenase
VGDSNNQLTNQVGLSDGANILWGTDGNDSLIGTAEDNVLIGRGGKDNLSGGPGKNSFLFQSLKDSLLSGFGPDHIRNLKIGADIIGGPNPVAASKVLKAGRVSKLTTREIRRVLTNKNFAPNRAAIFTAGKRTFVALNNNKAGFQANGVALIDITGYSGNLADLAIAGPRSYADPNEQYSMGGENNLIVGESDLVAQVLVRRTGNALTRETLEYVVTENSASIGDDFISPTSDGRENTGQAVFEVGEQTAYIRIPIVNDSAVEGTEALSVGLQKTSNGTLSFPRTVSINIIDNDGNPQIGFLSANLQTTEGSSSVTIKVIRSGNNADTVSVDFATSNGTAVAGLDYQPANGTITFGPGEIEKIITIDITGNNVPEPTEAFTLSLLNASPSVDLINSQTQVTILDDDQIGLSNFVRQEFVSAPRTTDFDFSPDGRYLFTATKEGIVRVVENGVIRDLAVIDISAQVNSRADRGIVGIAVHPDFYNQPYIYLAHTYDPPETEFLTGNAGRDGSGNRPARVVRLEVNLDTLVADLNSLKVILGSNSGIEFFDPSMNSTGDITIPATGVFDEDSLLPGVQYDKGFQDNDPGTPGIQNYNLRDYIATDSTSHTIGAIRFGPDGHLYVATGDGTSFNFPDPRTVRVQDPSNLSGKILRIDPMTGTGIDSNPFFDGDPNSNRSKVFYYGLRNPFRFTFDPVTKLPVIADVGWSTAEEVNTGPPGSNFGWPYFEGNGRTPRYRDLEEALRFYENDNVNESSPDPNPAVAPLLSPRRGELAGAIIVSDFIDKNTFVFGDLTRGRFFSATLNDDRSVGSITPFESVPISTVSIRKGPDNLLYAASLNRPGALGGEGLIYRWVPITDTINV